MAHRISGVFKCDRCGSVNNGNPCFCLQCVRCRRWSKSVDEFSVGDDMINLCPDDQREVEEFARQGRIR